MPNAITCLPVSGAGGRGSDGSTDRGYAGADRGGDGAADGTGTADGAGPATAESLADVCEEACLHLNFRGGFSRTGEAHRIIRHYAEEEGIALADSVVEVYNRDMSVDVYWPLKACPES